MINTLSLSLCYGFVHLFGRSVNRGEYEDPVARQCHPPKYRKSGSGPTDQFHRAGAYSYS